MTVMPCSEAPPRTIRLACVVCFLLLIVTSRTHAEAPESGTHGNQQERPNFVLIMCDDLGWGDVRFNHAETNIRTPNLNEMAANSMRFERFYSAAPVCSPTRGSCLTGRHPFRFGVYSANTGHLREGEVTIAELLSDQGYATGLFGKWHLGTLTKTVKDSNRGGRPRHEKHYSLPTDHGFDVYFSTEAKAPTYDPMIKPPGAGRIGWDFIQDKSQAEPYGTRYWNEQGKIVKRNLEGDDSRIIVDRATKFIRKSAQSEQPFFAVIWLHAPHLPVVAGPEHVQHYENYGLHQRNYYGCVSALDEQVGRVRKLLRELGIADNTMVGFCSDNGPEGNEDFPGLTAGLRGRKRSLYEGGIRVPGLIEWPARIDPGSETAFPAVTSDYLPTIIDAVGLAMPDDRPLDGISLLPLFESGDGPETRDKPIGFQSRGQRAWIANRYKIYKPRNGDWELYDLSVDRSETNNLASQRQERLSEMVEAYERWEASVQRSDQGQDYID